MRDDRGVFRAETLRDFVQRGHGLEARIALEESREGELEQCRHRLRFLANFAAALFPLVQREHRAQRPVDDDAFERKPYIIPLDRNAEQSRVLRGLLANVGETLAGEHGETDRNWEVVNPDVGALRPTGRGDRFPIEDRLAATIEREQREAGELVAAQLVVHETKRDVHVGRGREVCGQRGECFRRHALVLRVWRVCRVLSIVVRAGNFPAMADRTVQLVLQYDGARFAGWQRQPVDRTVQGELERVFERLLSTPTAVTGAGRTDAGVHARGQAAHVRVPDKWTPESLRRAVNALLPDDVWVAAAYAMDDRFHARYSATARSYRYVVGTDDGALSPFRRRYEWHPRWGIDAAALNEAAASVVGEHVFRGFAVRGTAPDTDDHRCIVTAARWHRRTHGDTGGDDGADGYVFEITANRFLHHMVRFLVGTMLDVAAGRRTLASFHALLRANDNRDVSPPAPPQALYLEHVVYPDDLYLDTVHATTPASATAEQTVVHHYESA